MFEFAEPRPNPIGGCASGTTWEDPDYRHCSFMCCYCWANSMKYRYKYPKYQGPWRLIPTEMRKHKPDDFPWPCDMIDIGDPTIPAELILKLLEWVGEQPCPMLLLTKNPRFYLDYRHVIPLNAVLGATIECYTYLRPNISQAPDLLNRIYNMVKIKKALPNRRFVSIEPIMRSSYMLTKKIKEIEPWAVAVGYDGYNNKLEEHSKAKTEEIIAELEEAEIIVFRKTIRERWDAE